MYACMYSVLDLCVLAIFCRSTFGSDTACGSDKTPRAEHETVEGECCKLLTYRMLCMPRNLFTVLAVTRLQAIIASISNGLTCVRNAWGRA